MTNFEYYIKGGRRYDGYRAFFKSSSLGTTTATRIVDNYTEWLLREHKEPILDDIEKEYISNIIKPFKEKVVYVLKNEGRDSYFIEMKIDNNGDADYMCLPNFSHSSKMYVNMKPHKKYTLKELGL